MEHLNPPLKASAASTPVDPAPSNPTCAVAPPRPPVAGFMRRAAAFIVDVVVLYAGAWLLVRLARPALLEFNPALPWLAQTVGFLYLWAFNGPLGEGRTPGKRLLNIHVVDRRGAPLGWGAAGRRALVLQIALWLALAARPDAFALIASPAQQFAWSVTLMLAGLVCLTTVMALAAGAAMHPCRQALHDLWSGAYVVPDPTPEAFGELMALQNEEAARNMHRRHLKFIAIFWPVVTVALLFKPVRLHQTPDVRARADEIATLNVEAGLDGYALTGVAFPGAGRLEVAMDAIAHQRDRLAAAGQTVPTTETLHESYLHHGQAIAVQAVLRRGSITSETLQNAALRASVERLHGALWEDWLARRDAPEPDTDAPPPPARVFHLLLVEPCRLIYYNATRVVVDVHGPPNPADGDLTWKIVSTASATHATTDSQRRE